MNGHISGHLLLGWLKILTAITCVAAFIVSCTPTTSQEPARSEQEPRHALAAAEQATETRMEEPGVVVAVIDSGIDTGLPLFAGRMWANADEIPGNGIDDDGNGYVDDVDGWDFRDNQPPTRTGIHWHGTAVASIIAAGSPATQTGPLDPRIRIMNLRVLDSENLFYHIDWPGLTDAIAYAVANGADIINLSIYSYRRPPAYFEDALSNAQRCGVAIIGIAGNTGSGTDVMYPGRCAPIIAVAATAENGSPAEFSCSGKKVEFAAMGEGVEVVLPGGVAERVDGTSFAAPQVSRAAALVLTCHPEFSAEEAVRFLRDNAIDTGPEGRDIYTGYGIIEPGAIEGVLLGGGVGAGVSP